MRLWPGALLLVTALSSPAFAQSPEWEVALGGAFSGSAPAGTVDATLIDPSGAPFTLYRANNRIDSGWGAEGVLSRRVSDRLRAELLIGWNSTHLQTEISSDFENASAASATLKVTQFTGELGLAYRIVRRGRFDVFLRAGGGGFRELTSDRALVENGWSASVGGGTQIRLRQAPSGWFGRLGLRADVRMQLRGGGIGFGDSGTRRSPSVFAGLVIGQ